MKMFNIPNLVTACNMLCGVVAIFLAFAGRIDIAPFFIFLGAILDFFDGFLARILKQQGEMGKQLDSLADMITFGLAPGVIMMFTIVAGIYAAPQLTGLLGKGYVFQDGVVVASRGWLTDCFAGAKFSFISLQNEWYKYLPFAALIIPFFSMFRLAKFNIDTRQSESFIGLPTPANTIFFMSFPLLLSQYTNSTGWEHDLIMWLVQPVVLIPIIVVMSLMLVAELPLFALKFKSFKWQGNEIRYVFLITCAILIPVLLYWSIPIIILLYLLLSVINNVRKRGQKQNV